MLLVCRFRPDPADPAGTELLERAREVLRLLTEQAGCTEATFAQAVDSTAAGEPGEWLLVARFDSVAAYRRALRPFGVRERVIPWLASALPDGSATYEPRLDARAGAITEHPSLVAADAGTVNLGDAAGPTPPR